MNVYLIQEIDQACEPIGEPVEVEAFVATVAFVQYLEAKGNEPPRSIRYSLHGDGRRMVATDSAAQRWWVVAASV